MLLQWFLGQGAHQSSVQHRGKVFFMSHSCSPMTANINFMPGNMSIKTNKCCSSYPEVSRGGPVCVPACAGLLKWRAYSPLLLARLQPRLCVLVPGSALGYEAGSRHGLLPDGQASRFLFLTCTTTFLAVPLQTPLPQESWAAWVCLCFCGMAGSFQHGALPLCSLGWSMCF